MSGKCHLLEKVTLRTGKLGGCLAEELFSCEHRAGIRVWKSGVSLESWVLSVWIKGRLWRLGEGLTLHANFLFVLISGSCQSIY